MKDSKEMQEMESKFGELGNWLKEKAVPEVPDEISETLRLFCQYLEIASQKTAGARGMRRHFLRAVGILPKSERSKKVGIQANKTKSIEEKRRLVKRLLSQLAREREKDLKPKKKEEGESSMKDFHDEAESGDYESDIEENFDEDFEKAMGTEGEPESGCCPLPDEEGLVGQSEEEGYICHRKEECKLTEEEVESVRSGPDDNVSVIEKKSSRVGFQVVIEKVEVTTQTAFSRKTGECIRASTDALGPRGKKVTWDGLVSLMTMMVGYLIPANRISGMLGEVGSYFTRARCTHLLQYTAKRLLPIHLEHVLKLSRAQTLHTDDTGARCPEAQRAKENFGLEGEETPWKNWTHRHHQRPNLNGRENSPEEPAQGLEPNPKDGLNRHVAWELGFLNTNKDGSPRKRLRTTVVIGKEDAQDMKSFVVLYHTHFGEAGDVLSRILQRKKESLPKEAGEKPTVWIVSDLLATNRPSDISLGKTFDIKTSGCMRHARRGFKINEDDDLVPCRKITIAFDCMASLEKEVTQRGRRTSNVLATRKYTARLWNYVHQMSEGLAMKWPEGHPVGRAARYVLGNYEELTRYLTEAHLPDNNSLSERMLRPERLMERSSLFRWSLEGRCAWNIVRGIYQTCQLTGVNFKGYLDWVLRASEEDISSNPENYTPHAYAHRK